MQVPTALGASGVLSRYGLATQSAGTVRLRINCVTQARKPLVVPTQSKGRTSAADAVTPPKK